MRTKCQNSFVETFQTSFVVPQCPLVLLMSNLKCQTRTTWWIFVRISCQVGGSTDQRQSLEWVSGLDSHPGLVNSGEIVGYNNVTGNTDSYTFAFDGAEWQEFNSILPELVLFDSLINGWNIFQLKSNSIERKIVFAGLLLNIVRGINYNFYLKLLTDGSAAASDN